MVKLSPHRNQVIIGLEGSQLINSVPILPLPCPRMVAQQPRVNGQQLMMQLDSLTSAMGGMVVQEVQ